MTIHLNYDSLPVPFLRQLFQDKLQCCGLAPKAKKKKSKNLLTKITTRTTVLSVALSFHSPAEHH